MKLLKAKIEITHDGGATQYIGYPQAWLDNKEKIPHILYPADRTDEVEVDGKLYQIVYPVVDDLVYDELIGLNGFEVPDKDELIAYSEKHTPRKEVIADQNKVLAILVKQNNGEKLSKEELDALDPEKPESGVNMSKSFVDFLPDYGIEL